VCSQMMLQRAHHEGGCLPARSSAPLAGNLPTSLLSDRSVSPGPSNGRRAHRRQLQGQQARAVGRQAVRLQGCKGAFDMVNATYEPHSARFADRPCWVARLDPPLYLFHSGKRRWVVSRRIGDAEHCYAFVPDEAQSESPVGCRGPWVYGNADGSWSEDSGIWCTHVAASSDRFGQLRHAAEDDLRRCGLLDGCSIRQLWRRLDGEGHDMVDLADIEMLVGDMVRSGLWPEWMHHRRAIERAFSKSLPEDFSHSDVAKEDFHGFLVSIFWFTRLEELFQDVDTNDDEQLDLGEFSRGLCQLGLILSPQEASDEFRLIDKDKTGIVDFGDFCMHVRRRVSPDDNPAFDEDQAADWRHCECLRRRHGDRATQSTRLGKKTTSDYNSLERRIRDLCREPTARGFLRLWKRLDFDGHGAVSLPELDRWAVEFAPLLNHRPALLRAHKVAACREEGLVQRFEFKRMLVCLFYFNKLFWLFDESSDQGGERQLDPVEFRWCLVVSGVRTSARRAEAEFNSLVAVSSAQSGHISFDEFCRHFSVKQCPEGFTDMPTG